MPDANLNMDFTAAVVIDTEAMDWTPSPQPGVERRRLEREQAESGRATSIVRYAPGVSFPTHVHGGGEEYLVLDGTLSDADGDFPAGTYVRNPPGTSHAPFSRQGCTIFVKLCQMAPRGEPPVVVRTADADWRQGNAPGHAVIRLFAGPGETVTVERLDSGTELGQGGEIGGEEMLVLSGTLQVDGTPLGRRTWIRRPAGPAAHLSSRDGCTVWIKRGHLAASGLGG